MKEVRCPACGKLLARAKGVIEIKCPRCKLVVTRDTEEKPKKELQESP